VKRSWWKRARDREYNGYGRGDDLSESFQTISTPESRGRVGGE
jgi:hypothetical protein